MGGVFPPWDFCHHSTESVPSFLEKTSGEIKKEVYQDGVDQDQDEEDEQGGEIDAASPQGTRKDPPSQIEGGLGELTQDPDNWVVGVGVDPREDHRGGDHKGVDRDQHIE